MIEQQKRNLHSWHTLESELLDTVKEGATAKELVEYLSDYDNRDFVVYRYEGSKRKLMQRVNMVWVIPLLFIVFPFQWLICGEFGVRRNNRIGRIIEKLVGFY